MVADRYEHWWNAIVLTSKHGSLDNAETGASEAEVLVGAKRDMPPTRQVVFEGRGKPSPQRSFSGFDEFSRLSRAAICEFRMLNKDTFNS